MKDKDTITQDFISFLDTSPTAWHAVANIKQKLLEHEFVELGEGEKWSLKRNKNYFVIRNGSSLCAFKIPSKGKIDKTRLIASHTDSPALKIKPNGEFRKQNMVMLGLEVYGSPLLTSWLNRDLGIAGRVLFLDGKNTLQEALVNIQDHPLVIPQLAIHLDRKVNEEGLLLNKQEHLSALATISDRVTEKSSYLDRVLKEKITYQKLLSSDLFLFPLEKARLVGLDHELLSSYRLDNLGGVHASLMGFLDVPAPNSQLNMAVFWDDEEIGSHTAQGAASPFLMHILERIHLSLDLSREDYLSNLANSFCISVDLAHALHPNYPEKHDPRHQPLLGEGVVLKSNAQQRYASNAKTASLVTQVALKRKLSLQHFVSRSDMPCGSTIGPIHAALTGMPTVDIGYPQLSMHSSRELVSWHDHVDMCHLIAKILN